MNFVEELRWRGMLHDVMPGTQEKLNSGMSAAYLGIDPTADSLHIGHLVGVMVLLHFQQAGHKPIALIGGATGMIGDPSGKSDERNLLTEDVLRANEEGIKKQLARFLDFGADKNNAAELVNNYDWISKFSFLQFMRDVGKHLTVNYMMAKDSVKKRLEGGNGISFTEFSYQLIQGYDFYYLWKHKNCVLQLGGSDQWGNITTGTELIRRIGGGEAFALTVPLLTKSDGSKFGKSEGGNIWLDPEKTSPFKFYQFWLNVSDEEAAKFIRIFTLKNEAEINVIEQEHALAPHNRLLQKQLAADVTLRVHGEDALETALKSTDFLFGNGSLEFLNSLNDEQIKQVFDGVANFKVAHDDFAKGILITDLLAVKTNIFSSKGEAKKMVQGGGLSVNRNKINDAEMVIDHQNLINQKFIVVQKGKKNYFLIEVM